MLKLFLYVFSFVYGLVVAVRNRMYDFRILKSVEFQIPVICVGNITVGGTGKTPHIEYLVRLLASRFKVVVLSRGYKRTTKGFRRVETFSAVSEVGDEPLQMKRKFPSVGFFVCEDRVIGVTQLLSEKPDVVLLDDAFQHRRILPGQNILLIDYNKPMKNDRMLPAGRLRESIKESGRANIIIVTKCPPEITPITRRINEKEVKYYPFQEIFFTTMTYSQLQPAFSETPLTDLFTDLHKTGVLVITGIASPEYVIDHMKKLSQEVDSLVFPDHHYYSESDIQKIVQRFKLLRSSKKIILTTEKDITRLSGNHGFSAEIKSSVYYLPVQVRFLDDEGKMFNKKIVDYVAENKSNRELHLRKNKYKS
jgi:tetraacyldisaccharide 4'-kinase